MKAHWTKCAMEAATSAMINRNIQASHKQNGECADCNSTGHNTGSNSCPALWVLTEKMAELVK